MITLSYTGALDGQSGLGLDHADGDEEDADISEDGDEDEDASGSEAESSSEEDEAEDADVQPEAAAREAAGLICTASPASCVHTCLRTSVVDVAVPWPTNSSARIP